MATVSLAIDPLSFRHRSTFFPGIVKADGSTYPMDGLAFDTAIDEYAFFRQRIAGYGSGNLTLNILWYAATATSGNVVWTASIAAITPDSDTQDVTTDGLASEATVTDSHLGTTGKRLHVATITISSLDSLANGDMVTLRVGRPSGTNGSDTMSGDAVIAALELTYSDV